MDMTGERRIPAPREAVWAALNDPEVLKASIPGCESLEVTSQNEMKAMAVVKVGPMSVRFNGKVQLSNIDPPNSYRISGEGQGGVAGFAKGEALVSLQDYSIGTLLVYEVHAQVGGKLAQLGARLIDATAKQTADSFFDRFSAHITSVTLDRTEETEDQPLAEPSAGDLSKRSSQPASPAPSVIQRKLLGLTTVAWISVGTVILLLVVVGRMLV